MLHRTVVTAALTTVLTSLLCAGLAISGWWAPWVAFPSTALLAAASWRVSRVIGDRSLPLWTASLLVLVAAGSAAWAGATRSEQVVPRRDAGSYAQYATYLATAHRLPVAVPAASVGGAAALAVPGVTLASPAFYQVGSAAAPAVQPQFLIGAPAWYSLARWAGGVNGMLAAPALFGGLCVLALGLLTSATVGPRWGPLGALAGAVSFPFLHTVRATYSEPVAMLVLVAGLLVATLALDDSGSGRWSQARRLALLAGILVGGGTLVRADALRETLLLLPVAALLMLRRDAAGGPMLLGAGAATLAGGLTAGALAYRYLGDIAGSLVPLVAGGVVLAGLTGGVVLLARRGLRLPGPVCRALPWAGSLGVLLGAAVLASRPLWQTVRQSAADPGARVVAGLQQQQGLAVDGGRTYAEQTLVWMTWWVGGLTLAAAFAVLAVLAWRLARAWTAGRPLPAWTAAAVVGLGSSALIWWRPGITPDHPWADRRLLVPLFLVAVCVAAACAEATRYARRRAPVPLLAAVGLLVPAGLLLPSLGATWPHLTERVEAGSVAAVDQACDAFTPGDVALAVDARAANEWPQVLRGWCGVPALALTAAAYNDPAARAGAVRAVARAVSAEGGRLVLAAAGSAAALAGHGPTRLAVDMTVQEDLRLLERRPDGTMALPYRLWLAPADGRR